jgi:hypothetical protein
MPVDVNRLRAEGVYEVREPAAELVADLDQIQGLAAEWHAARKRMAMAGAFTLLAGFIGTIVFFPVGLLLLVVGGWFLYRMKVYPKAVANHEERCAFGKSMAKMLASDADPKTPIAMRLAFDPKRETLSEGALPHRKNGKELLYKVSWFSVAATLHDGATFSQTVDDVVRERKFTNRRGKSKSKTRTRSLIGLRLDYPEETYGDMSQFQAKMQSEIQLPQGVALRGVEVNSKAIKAKVLVSENSRTASLAQTSSMLALGVYRMLNLSREIAERKRIQAKKGGAA